jgi:hypothetical protein
MNILVPSFDSESPPESSTTLPLSATYKDIAQTYGLGSNTYKLDIHVPASSSEGAGLPSETDENQIVFETVRESLRLLKTKHIPAVQKWLQAITTAEGVNQRALEKDLKRAIDLKRILEDTKMKAEEILENSLHQKKGTDSDEDEFDDEEFVEVDNAETAKKATRRVPSTAKASRVSSRAGSKPVFTSSGVDIDQEVTNTTAKKVKEDKTKDSKGKKPVTGSEPIRLGPSASLKGKPSITFFCTVYNILRSISDLTAVAPEVDYDDDLYYWSVSSFFHAP